VTTTITPPDAVVRPSGEGSSRRVPAPEVRVGQPRPWKAVASIVVLVAGTAAGLAGAFAAQSDRIDSAGLIRTLPPAYFVGVALVIAAIVVGVAPGPRSSSWWTAACVTSLAVLLHGLPGIIETNPRFPVAWLHVGFIDAIARTGQILPLDARFSWAGFFSGGALVQKAGDSDSLLWLVRFTPVAVELFACWGVALIGSVLGYGARRRLLAMTIFLLASWTGQDYFSPQGTTFCMVLVVFAIAIAYFRTNPRTAAPRMSWLLRSEDVTLRPVSSRAQTLAYIACLAIIVSLAFTHQLSPLFLGVTLILFYFTGAARTRGLGAVALIVAITWVAFGATPYWIGHFEKITSTAGEVGTNLYTNVSGRTHGDLDRKLAVFSRLGLAALVWGMAGLALLIDWLRRRTPVVLFCLLVAPVPMFVAQSYGGEMLIRILLFSLPPGALLVAGLLDAKWLRRAVGRIAVALCLIAVVPIFMLARYGNETYEQVSPADLAVVSAVYDDAPDGSHVYFVNGLTVQFWQRVGSVRFRELHHQDPEEVIRQIKTERQKGKSYIVLTESQAAFGEQFLAQPIGWKDKVEKELLATGDFDVLAEQGGAVALEYTGSFPS
jgi:hypothetical protein